MLCFSASAFNHDIGVGTQQVTDMNRMFVPLLRSTKTFRNWNTEKVTDMNGMFSSASAFNQTWELGHGKDKEICFFLLYLYPLRSIEHWELEHGASD